MVLPRKTCKNSKRNVAAKVEIYQKGYRLGVRRGIRQERTLSQKVEDRLQKARQARNRKSRKSINSNGMMLMSINSLLRQKMFRIVRKRAQVSNKIPRGQLDFTLVRDLEFQGMRMLANSN